jgi:hypothetical protein
MKLCQLRGQESESRLFIGWLCFCKRVLVQID